MRLAGERVEYEREATGSGVAVFDFCDLFTKWGLVFRADYVQQRCSDEICL